MVPLAYGTEHDRQVVDIYYKDDGKTNKPVIIFFHGGAWVAGGRQFVDSKDVFFTNEGYIFVSAGYWIDKITEDSTIRYPNNAVDVAHAISFVYDNIAAYGGNKDNISVLGHSSGAHLAALVCTNERFLAMFGKDISIVKNMIELESTALDLEFRIFQGSGAVPASLIPLFGNDPVVVKDASPKAHIAPNKNLPRFMLVVSSNISNNKDLSIQFGQALEANGYYAQYHNRGQIGNSPQTHIQINEAIGTPDDALTAAVMLFLDPSYDVSGYSAAALNRAQPTAIYDGRS